MSQQLSPGQWVRISESVEKYGGLFGEIIHREGYSKNQLIAVSILI